MFDNGIFASFIPQILMVLGYISCLIAPKIFVEKDLHTLNAVEISLTSEEESVVSEKTAFYFDFNADCEIIQESDDANSWSNFPKVHLNIPYRHLRANDGLFFSRFSRPPPICFS